MTKKELLELPGFKDAKDDAQIWILCPNLVDECIPIGAYYIGFIDGTENLVISTKEPEDTWQRSHFAAKTLNDMNLGILFYPALFPYLRKRGKLEGYCELRYQGRGQYGCMTRKALPI